MTELMIKVGDALHWLKQMAPDSINCVITSPPYFGLRDYGAEGQIGLEPSIEPYLAKLVEVFGEVRRVLKGDGTLWLNMGDSYSRDPGKGQHKPGDAGKQNYIIERGNGRAANMSLSGLPDKNLIGIPWRLAFALQADGWYLRQDIIWHKPNPMPESVRDRCTKAHEYIFLLTKSATYRFDADAIKEAAVGTNEHDLTGQGYAAPGQTAHKGNRKKGNARTFRGGGAYTAGQSFDNSSAVTRESRGNVPNASGRRNKRSVWTITPEPFKEAHFATFPTKLVEPCMLAGSPVHGVVLDPFGGSGTVGVVAKRLKRHCVLLELNPAYAEIARTRIANS